MGSVTLTRHCEDCDVEFDIECSVTGSMMHEDCWGRRVSWDETEVEFESSTRCPGCGEDFDGRRLVDEAMEMAVT